MFVTINDGVYHIDHIVGIERVILTYETDTSPAQYQLRVMLSNGINVVAATGDGVEVEEARREIFYQINRILKERYKK